MGRSCFLRRSRIIYLGIVVLVVVLNTAAWNSTAFSDWYITYIFPIWVNVYGRVTGLFSFSMGEWLIVAGLVLAVLALAFAIVWGCIGLAMLFGAIKGVDPVMAFGDGRPDMEEKRERGGIIVGFGRFSRRFYCFFLWMLLAVSLIMTLNCFILYHASTFSEHYFGTDDGEYALEDLIKVYNMVAEQCNSLAGEILRDEDGMVMYTGSLGKDGTLLDMEDKARELMRQLGQTYPQLDGYYPRPKALVWSDFMCQQHMQGYYFPFSMEANYNDVMHILNFPATMCHELAHLRGYIYEDEANFIGYLACAESEDIFFRYAGYLSVLTYLNNDLYKAWKEDRAAYEKAAAAIPPVTVDVQVWEDNVFVTEDEWERINGKALIDTEIVDAAADVFIDTNLKVNGIADGKISYSRVVRLLLQYYRHQNDSSGQ